MITITGRIMDVIMAKRPTRKHSNMIIIYRDSVFILIICLIYLYTYFDARAGWFRKDADATGLKLIALGRNHTKAVSSLAKLDSSAILTTLI